MQMEHFESCAHNEQSGGPHRDSVSCGLCNDLPGGGNVFRLATRVRRGDDETMTGGAV